MDSFAKLLKGYEDFRDSLKGSDVNRFAELANGQAPETLMITCSDSRVDPSLMTGARPGELFVVRNAGNIVPQHGCSCSADLGTIQFAVEVLGVKHIVVCGHSDCGAVKAMLNPESVRDLPLLSKWIEEAGQGLRLREDFSIVENVRLNALHQIARLEQLDFVSERVRAGALRLHAWTFNIGAAALETFSFTPAGWVSLTSNVEPLASNWTEEIYVRDEQHTQQQERLADLKEMRSTLE